jgi:hypothetical protein
LQLNANICIKENEKPLQFGAGSCECSSVRNLKLKNPGIKTFT